MAEAPNAKEETSAAKPPKRVPLLHDRYQVDPGTPLPELDSPSAKAYAVTDRREAGKTLFALICMPGLPPRTDVMEIIADSYIPGILPLVDWGPVNWPAQGRQCMAVVYERPMGGRFMDFMAKDDVRLSEYELPRILLRPLASGLAELAQRGATHRAVRPDNIFFLDAGRKHVVLGDCVTSPPGYDQPPIFESIECSMADPAGRGDGEGSDDLFALGVTLVYLILDHDPVAKMTPDQLLAARVEKGTYAAICTNNRIAMYLLDALRGILADNASDRWKVEDLERWINGGGMVTVRRQVVEKAEVGFTFAGTDYVTLRTLAHALACNPAEAAKTIKSGELGPWLNRSMNNARLAESMTAIAEMANTHASDIRNSDEYLAAEVSTLLDPAAPVRYKGLSFLPEAYGPVLAVDFLRGGNAEAAAEAVTHGVVGAWFAAQRIKLGVNTILERNFQKVKGHLANNDPGYGIERCLYMLNPSLPCQSSLIVQDHVVNILELLPALDRAAGRTDSKTKPMDRHLLAFIAARFSQDIGSLLRRLVDTGEDTVIVGLLNLLAYLQWRLKAGALYGLTSWLGGLLGPAIKTYHSRTTRSDIEREIPRIVRQGSLPELYDVIDNADKRRADIDGHAAVVAEFATTEEEIHAIESHDENREAETVETGQKAAALSSVVTMLIAASIFLIMDLW
jgi:hypothetical protein